MSQTTDDVDIDLYRIYSVSLIINLARIPHDHWRAMWLPSMFYVVRWLCLIFMLTAIPVTIIWRTGDIIVVMFAIPFVAAFAIKNRRIAGRLLRVQIRNDKFRTYAVERGFLRLASPSLDRCPPILEELGDILLLPGLALTGLCIGVLAYVAG